ncbi:MULTISPECIES: hypothetical protein [unclassified Kitasatospora]|uniref:hypothetical protein n=1 Tax=unclassified Kitasatospora TaxID=2633591 RepID=UPI0024765D5D|nr:hypothetical protein [Kitasatospora sp. MAP12-44]
MHCAHLHAIAPHLDLASLRHLLGGEACAALVQDSWDGPHLRLSLPAGPDAARSVELLLSGGELTPTFRSPAPTPRITLSSRLPSSSSAQDAALAWQRTIGSRGPAFVLDPVGPPVLPAGWLLRSWSNPLAGRVQCTIRPPRPGVAAHRLHLESPGLATPQELTDLLADWTNAL